MTHSPKEPFKHVLVVAYYFPPMGLSGVQRIAKLVKFLPRHGWRVTVITPKVGAYFAFDDGLLAELTAIDGVRIVRTSSLDPTRLFTPKQRSTVAFPEENSRQVLSFLSQLVLLPDNKIGWKRFAVRAARKIMKLDPFSAVFATAPPYTSFLIGKEISRTLGVPLVLDYRDDWIDNTRHIYPTRIHKSIVRKQEMAVVRSAKLVLAINQVILDQIKSRTDTADTAYHLVPQGFDPEDFGVTQGFAPEDFDMPKEEKTSTKPMVFTYTGMFYDAQQPDSFLKALKLVFDQSPALKTKIRARFVGLFPESKKALIDLLGLTEVVQLEGYVSHQDSIRFLMESDVAWMTVGRQPREASISTGKLFEYIGSGKPILGLVPNGAAKQVLHDYGAGITVDPDDVQGISAHIRTLFGQWEGGELPSPSSSAQEQYDRNHQAGIVAGFLNNLR